VGILSASGRTAKAIADMSAEAVFPEQIKRISGYLNNWDNIGLRTGGLR